MGPQAFGLFVYILNKVIGPTALLLGVTPQAPGIGL